MGLVGVAVAAVDVDDEGKARATASRPKLRPESCCTALYNCLQRSVELCLESWITLHCASLYFARVSGSEAELRIVDYHADADASVVDDDDDAAGGNDDGGM